MHVMVRHKVLKNSLAYANFLIAVTARISKIAYESARFQS